MKICYIIFTFLFLVLNTKAQLLPGTLDVNGFPNIAQSVEDLVDEAGIDDGIEGFESEINATEISFLLDSSSDPITGLGITSDANCSENIYKYSVYIHTDGAPNDAIIEAKTFLNSGNRFPATALYDNLPVQPLGPRNLYPENGGSYIVVPNSGTIAIKIMEFIGCRQNIPIQFRTKASVLSAAGQSTLSVIYTVVGSLN